MFLRFLLVSFRDSCKSRWQCLWNLRFHHFVESLTHFFLVCLDLAHCRDVTLGDLVVVLHIILQSLIIIVSHLFWSDTANFWELVSLIISLGHRYLILRVKRKFAVTPLEFGHERGGKGWLPLCRLRHWREVRWMAYIGWILLIILLVERVSTVEATYLLTARLYMWLTVMRGWQVKLAAHMLVLLRQNAIHIVLDLKRGVGRTLIWVVIQVGLLLLLIEILGRLMATHAPHLRWLTIVLV